MNLLPPKRACSKHYLYFGCQRFQSTSVILARQILPYSFFLLSFFFFCGSVGETSTATYSKLQHFDKKHKIHYSCGMLNSMLYFPSLLCLLLCVQKRACFTYAYWVMEESFSLAVALDAAGIDHLYLRLEWRPYPYPNSWVPHYMKVSHCMDFVAQSVWKSLHKVLEGRPYKSLENLHEIEVLLLFGRL